MATQTNGVLDGHISIFPSIHFTHAVNANDLYNYFYPLSQTDDSKNKDLDDTFQIWISDRISHYGFEVNFDYALEDEILLEELPKRYHLSELILSLNMAKELARIEGSERGREARYYLLEFELKTHGRINQAERQELLQKERRQLLQQEKQQLNALNPETLAQHIQVNGDVAEIAVADLIHLIKAIQLHQKMALIYLPSNVAGKNGLSLASMNDLNPEWLNELIEAIQTHTVQHVMNSSDSTP